VTKKTVTTEKALPGVHQNIKRDATKLIWAFRYPSLLLESLHTLGYVRGGIAIRL